MTQPTMRDLYRELRDRLPGKPADRYYSNDAATWRARVNACIEASEAPLKAMDDGGTR